jgi:hypothetical protein
MSLHVLALSFVLALFVERNGLLPFALPPTVVSRRCYLSIVSCCARCRRSYLMLVGSTSLHIYTHV